MEREERFLFKKTFVVASIFPADNKRIGKEAELIHDKHLLFLKQYSYMSSLLKSFIEKVGNNFQLSLW